MLEQVRHAIRCGRMVEPGDKVIVAVSGGPDSVALLHVLHRLSGELGVSLHVFHMDHGLRGAESAADAAFVQALSEKLGLPCTIARLPAGQLKDLSGSLQANARQARYSALVAVAQQVGATRAAYGHNRDDQAETVLMRFLRGAGPRGLAGIPPVRTEGKITHIRPLLGITRQEIEDYCRANELFPRVDQSNLTPVYLRNRIRLELLPYLTGHYNPALPANLAQMAAVMRDEDELLDTLAEEAYARCSVPAEGIALLGHLLLREPAAIARRVVRLAARTAAGMGYDLGLGHVTQILEAASRSEGTERLHLPGGLTVLVEYGICRFNASEAPVPPDAPVGIAVSGVTSVPEFGIEISASAEGVPVGRFEAVFDLSLLPGPLSLRRRRPGDRFWPTGMNGSKKVQDLLVDAKVPGRLRDQVPILVSGEEILWVVGYRLDRRFLATPGTKSVLFLRVTHLAAGP